MLFDALAKSFVNSPSQTMISDLYTGTTVNLIQCLSCGYSSEVGADAFLVIIVILVTVGAPCHSAIASGCLQHLICPVQREESLDDISVPIKGFADLEARYACKQLRSPCLHLESPSSLRAYTALELMTGDNKYKCGGCGQLCDAHRGVKFRQLPPVLTLNLMRFR